MPIHRRDLIVLIAEDEAIVAEILRNSLRDSGLETEPMIVQNGKKALEIINSGKMVDLLLTDGYMPEMNGPDLITALWAQNFPGQIIALTGDMVNEETFKRMGLPFLFKPYRLAKLVDLINQLFPARVR